MSDNTKALTIAYLDELRVSVPRDRLWLGFGHSAGADDCFSTFEITSKSIRDYRAPMVQRYSWAIPCEEALQVLVALSPVVEMGAGTGYWTHLLRERGVDVVAYDQMPPDGSDSNGFHRGATPWTSVLIGSPQMLEGHAHRTLLLCWPPMTDMAAECLRVYRGSTVVYVGEGNGGCTGDDVFHEALGRNFVQKQEVCIPQWGGIHDYMTVWSRR